MNYHIYYCLILSFWVIVSCDSINSEEPIPAFLTIDTAYATINNNLQGTAAQHITNIWLYNGTEPLGTFPLPAKIPILAQGNATLIFQAGVKLNNQSTNRAMYEVFTNDSLQVNLKPGENVNYQPTFSYKDKESAYFHPIYDFELSNNFTSTVNSAPIQITSNENFVFEGNRSLTVVIDELNTSFKAVSKDVIEVQTASMFAIDELPVDGRNSYIEMHYKNDATLIVGLITNSIGLPNFSSEILKIGPKKEWSKIYIPLKQLLTSNNFEDVRLYFEGSLPGTMQTARYSLDNIKIIHEL